MMFALLQSSRVVRSFVVPTVARAATSTQQHYYYQRFWASTSSSLPDIDGMRAGEIKKELESYGINTKKFLEKSELVDALKRARDEGLQPPASTASSSSTSTTTDSSSTSSGGSASSADSRPRTERLQEELEKCKAMKASELKKELEERGVSTKSFFEKSEFAQALAEARVDGVQKKAAASNGESYAEYADVEVLTDDSSGPRKRQEKASAGGGGGGGAGSSPFGGSPFGSASPFGGMGGMGGMPGMGGMGGMGGIADMLKNMGGGASPFGGAASPFGGPGGADVMGKAQQMMQNPRVRELMAKAQSNPRLMKILNECMTNPMALSKYENDPEVSELIKELKKFM